MYCSYIGSIYHSCVLIYALITAYNPMYACATQHVYDIQTFCCLSEAHNGMTINANKLTMPAKQNTFMQDFF